MLNTVIHGEATDAPPLLIVHGLFGSARNWGVIARRLSADRQVIAVDMRNHGDSPWHDTHSYADLADDLAAIIPDRMDVLGHSMGGKAAMMLALTQPDKVRRLIVADIAPVAYGHSQQGPIDLMRDVDLATVDSRKDAAAQMGEAEAATKAFLLQSLDLQNRRWMLNIDVLEAQMDQIMGFPDTSATFAGPSLFLHGANSKYVLPEHHAAIAARFPQARIQTIADAGHWLHAEQPAAVIEAVAAFLTEGDAP